ncbi:MAG: hypothetical protein M0D57_07395 [Sphingobacteriales bacterium JAD_PAG50586_3]|nr:MAG: hypothetical protein M0D57_07395 [Sphingobacteriales bacterium JAD_PAG50586_3]
MKSVKTYSARYLAFFMLVLGLIAFTSATASNHFAYDADMASVEVELADFDIDETNNYHELLHFTLSNIWNASSVLDEGTPVTFSVSAGFHSKNSTGKSICVQFRKLKLYC